MIIIIGLDIYILYFILEIGNQFSKVCLSVWRGRKESTSKRKKRGGRRGEK